MAEKLRYEAVIDGKRFFNVHSPDNCAGTPCVIHNQSDHHMREWPLHWRGDRAMFERICPHGVGHPDPDHLAFRPGDSVHGCDGCCTETPGEDDG